MLSVDMASSKRWWRGNGWKATSNRCLIDDDGYEVDVAELVENAQSKPFIAACIAPSSGDVFDD